MSGVRELSIFIDESGDFGPYEIHCPYYLLGLVFHDQDKPIGNEIDHLKRRVVELGFPQSHSIHTAPLVRRESNYRNLERPQRRMLFHSLFTFFRFCDVKYKVLAFSKRDVANSDELVGRMARSLGSMIVEHLEFFQAYDRVIVYYDNGQKEVSRVINSVFNTLLSCVEIRRVQPSDYCLFQVADMVCTIELLATKLDAGRLTDSEREFFRGERTFRKNYLKPTRMKQLR
ncbi:DUF3800 domain-containing protein [Arabiibacter massiliensis]|uniref:DUF3800 domain-containing protein n=1 Tax=Arabiibacter massiliensis TaxID=1870985 RepID=UPI00117ABB74|nr:DUF3800 domain-containing protein [Arabiibacter massiliensis]